MKNLALLLGVAALTFLPVQAQTGPYLKEFAKHWAVSKQLTLDVANAMPDASYNFKPNPEEMSFGELMIHIGQANSGRFAAIAGEKSPFTKPEKADKVSAMKYLEDTFDYCGKVVAKMQDADLEKMIGPEGKQMSAREIMWAYFTHTAHHRGQAEVYLRLKDIKPPVYKF
jgi:uncharacterized damage-inducible protein DinB